MDAQTGLEPATSPENRSSLSPSLGGSRIKIWSPDKKSLKALFDAYGVNWEWGTTPVFPPEVLAQGKAAGVMFDSVTMAHDELVAQLQEQVRQITPREVGSAFIASLSTRRLDWRSALGSYAFARHLVPHQFERWETSCGVCGAYPTHTIDLNGESHSRYKWGGSSHTHPDYAWFDLTQFIRYGAAQPTDEDWELWRKILAIIKAVPEGRRASDLEKALGKTFSSNQNERRGLIEILAIAGVLERPEYPGYLDSFVRYDFSGHCQVRTSDWDYPACRWRSTGKVNEAAMSYWFG
jgi:hypothetical protein